MWLAAHVPERIERMVVCCSSPYLPPPENWRERARTVLEAGTTEPIADAVVDRWLTPGYAAAHPDVRTWLRSMITACDPRGYAACCGAIERMDLRGDLPRITAPTLVISAAEDLAAPPEHGQAIAAGVAGARLHMLNGGAHIASVECAEEVTGLIAEHLGKGGSGGGA
jgi:pimeloyl-ACP methyl ester carboxylesterase